MEPIMFFFWVAAICGTLITITVTASVIMLIAFGIMNGRKAQKQAHAKDARLQHPAYGKLRAVPDPKN